MSVLSTAFPPLTATSQPARVAEPGKPVHRPRLKVLWLAQYPYPSAGMGHPAPWVAALAASLRRQPEIELTILDWHPGLSKPIDEFDKDGIHFIYLRAPSFRQDLLTLYAQRVHSARKYLRQHHHAYDVLHLHGSEWQLPAVVPGLERPVVLSVQGVITEYLRYLPENWSRLRLSWKIGEFYERRYLPAVHEFICRTSWDKALMARLSPGARIHHNWEMMRPEFYEPEAQPAAEPRPQVLFTGGNQLMKGFKEVVAAFSIIRQQSPLKLVMAGRVTLAEVNQEARKLGLTPFSADEVECVGFCNARQLAALMRESFCLLHPSYIDNSPNTVCEAQLVGLPVVASQVGGVPDLIETESTGLLSDLNPASLAVQVLRLYHSPELAATLRRESRQVAAIRHDRETIVQRTMAIYHTLC
ncbi:glycosyltransferase family 4 protein [Hymenobacter sp. BT730]|uniref:glycosyltransferase family 4 protein n=1 Tax=Hymenobacter sp. BT730 TaxID=3063332 RepID=UPI0026DF785A|nr:glycosyltransferase [Hymenobacter sp. BT730]